MFIIRQEIFMHFAAILSMKFEYCATQSLVNHEPHSSNPLQNLKAIAEGLTQSSTNHIPLKIFVVMVCA